MNKLNLKEMIVNKIENIISSRSTSYSEIHLNDICDVLVSELNTLGYEANNTLICDGEWVQDDKYQYNEDYCQKVIVDKNIFYVYLSQSRSGSAFSEYNYNEAYLSGIFTEAEENAPKQVLTKKIDDKYDIIFLSNDNVSLINKETNEKLDFVNIAYFLKYWSKTNKK